jgi:3-dehydroquinate synthase
VLVVSNDVVAPLYLQRVVAGLEGLSFSTLILADGEAHKTLDSAARVFAALAELKASRDATIVALGGGVIGDLSGFAAACWMRGIAFVQMPTTLLAMVDSSVGGKTAVDLPQGKNLVGAFHQPRAVVVDTGTLSTLPERELRAGLAEVVKYGALGDAAFFTWLEQHADALLERDAQALAQAIAACCWQKAGIVSRDETEQGERALLNFGHTFGHAIEAAQGYGAWLHGEAVAAGMVCAAKLSERVCGLDASHTRRLTELVAAAQLPTVPPKIAADRWLELMGRDKKVADGAVRFVLLERLGHAVLRRDVASADVTAVVGG